MQLLGISNYNNNKKVKKLSSLIEVASFFSLSSVSLHQFYSKQDEEQKVKNEKKKKQKKLKNVKKFDFEVFRTNATRNWMSAGSMALKKKQFEVSIRCFEESLVSSLNITTFINVVQEVHTLSQSVGSGGTWNWNWERNRLVERSDLGKFGNESLTHHFIDAMHFIVKRIDFNQLSCNSLYKYALSLTFSGDLQRLLPMLKLVVQESSKGCGNNKNTNKNFLKLYNRLTTVSLR